MSQPKRQTRLAPAEPRRSPKPPPVSGPAGWSRCRPRRFTASPATPPTTAPSRRFTPPRAGRVQSADRPCRRRGGRGARRRARRFRPPARPGVLAGAVDDRRARRAKLPGEPAGARRPRDAGAARARSSDRPGVDRGGGRAARGALGQPFRPPQPDDRRPCRRRPRRPNRLDPRRRRGAQRRRIDDRRLPRRAAAPVASRRADARADRSLAGSRARRSGAGRRADRPRPARVHYAPRARLGSARANSPPTRRGSISAARWRIRARRRDSICRPPATSKRPPPICLPICARSTTAGRRGSPPRRSPSAGWASPSTTGCVAPRRRALRAPDAATSCRGGCGIRFLAGFACASAYDQRFPPADESAVAPMASALDGNDSV